MSRRKIGRPSKADVAERERRKKAWRREEQRRRQMESRIKQGLVQTTPVFPPAFEFVLGRVNGASVEECGASVEEFDAVWYEALGDLLASDVPLDANMRMTIAGALWRRAHPAEAKRSAIRAKIKVVRDALAKLERRGETPTEAFDHLAEWFGHASGAALQKWLAKHDV